jgi:hypothetical protein
MTQQDDRRTHPRVDAHLVVRSRQLDPSELPILASSLGRPDPPIPALNVVKNGARITQMATVNLSLGGLSAGGDLEIDSEKGYAKGSDVVVEFELNDGQPPVRAVAQVMWDTNADGRHFMGLMFLLISDSAFMRIQDFVQKNLVP